MRKVSAIFFLLVILFNIVGYKLVLWCVDQFNQQQFAQMVDRKAYNEQDLVSIKTTLHLPYYSGSADFERAYGTITIDGVEHEYVKRRVYRDTLELLCLPDYGKQKINKADEDIAKSNSEAATVPLGKKGSSLKINFQDYCSDDFYVNELCSLPSTNQFYSFQDHNFLKGFLKSFEKPPQHGNI